MKIRMPKSEYRALRAAADAHHVEGGAAEVVRRALRKWRNTPGVALPECAASATRADSTVLSVCVPESLLLGLPVRDVPTTIRRIVAWYLALPWGAPMPPMLAECQAMAGEDEEDAR